MIYGSVCSGIEAATVAWHGLGWRAAFYSEIDRFPRAVLQHHYPDTPLHGDFTTIESDQYDAIDLLVGGTPCQSFSIAGLRKGLDDERGNLALEYLRLAQRLRPRWLVWENVPGVLSSSGGRDFGAFLGGLGELGYGFAYRVLDAQYFGVAQRRRRVFVVGYLGDWRRAAAVLFEPESLSGHPAPSREAREAATGFTASSFGKYREGSGTLRAKGGDIGPGSETLITQVTHTLRAEHDASEDGTGRGTPLVPVCAPIDASYGSTQGASHQDLNHGHSHLVTAFHPTQDPISGDVCHALGANANATAAVAFTASSQANSYAWESDVYPTLNAQVPNDTSNIQYGIRRAMQVRRLTPRECERLQGFPDDFTLIPWKDRYACLECGERYIDPHASSIGGLAPAECPFCGSEAAIYDTPDGPRYKALGNSMAVPCMRWIGERIQMVEDVCNG